MMEQTTSIASPSRMLPVFTCTRHLQRIRSNNYTSYNIMLSAHFSHSVYIFKQLNQKAYYYVI